jgi:hypothetical protein
LSGLSTLPAPEIFVIGLDNQAYGAVLTQGGTMSSGYQLAAPGQIKALDVMVSFQPAPPPPPGQRGRPPTPQPELIGIGLDNQVYAANLSPTTGAGGSFFLALPGAVQEIQDSTANLGLGPGPAFLAIGLDNPVYSAVAANLTGTAFNGYFLPASGQVMVGGGPN